MPEMDSKVGSRYPYYRYLSVLLKYGYWISESVRISESRKRGPNNSTSTDSWTPVYEELAPKKFSKNRNAKAWSSWKDYGIKPMNRFKNF